MASVSLQIGSQAIPLSGSQLSPKDLAEASADVKLLLDGGLTALIAKPLSSLNDGVLTKLTLDAGNPSWKLGGSPATFSLKAQVIGQISLQSKGSLFSFYRGYDSTEPETYAVAGNRVYIITELQFNISGDLKASAQEGLIGITTDNSASRTYVVRNYKAFDGSKALGDAVKEAIAGFSLPLHSGTVDNLADGDCLYYEFDGAINVGFGVSYGLSKSVGAFSVSELSATLQKYKNVVDFSSSDIFTVGASAGVSVKFTWSRSFQCYLKRSKANPQDAGSAELHISAGNDSQRSVQIAINGGISKVSAPQLSVGGDVLANWALGKITGQANPAASSIQQKVADAAKQEVGKYVSDANDWISGLFQKIDSHGNVALSLLFQSTNHFVSAFTWNFDRGNAAFAQAWPAAVGGDYVSALSTGAVTLDEGSGFERLHCQSTKITFSFFGLLNCSSIETYFDQSTLRYGGNGLFYLETKTGRVATTTNNSKKTSTSIYLDARTKASATALGTPQAADVTIRLHGILTASDDSTQTSRLGVVLQSLASMIVTATGPQALVASGKLLKDYSRQRHPGACSLHLIFAGSALDRLRSDEYVRGNQPSPPHALDNQNWNAFVWASDQVKTEVVNYLQTWVAHRVDYESYGSWAVFNCFANGFTDADGNPQPDKKTDRHLYGNPQVPGFRRYFNETLSDTDANQLLIYFSAGQQYMNLCDDLHCTLEQIGDSETIDWDRLCAKIAAIAREDIDSWFGPAVLLALAKSCRSLTAEVQSQNVVPNSSSANLTVNIS
jgi:hypothetical protein